LEGTFTLRDLTGATGAKPRSLQLWADAGVIRPKRGTNHAGTGTHRLFSRSEAIIACVISAFAQHQIAIGELLNISKRVRAALSPASEGDDQDDLIPNTNIRKTAAVIEAAINGDPSWLLVYESWKEDVRKREDGPRDLQTAYSVTAVKAGKDMSVPKHLFDPDGFAVVICLATYLSGLDQYAAENRLPP
jgi:DNA-binding transcriptional MerR regulator